MDVEQTYPPHLSELNRVGDRSDHESAFPHPHAPRRGSQPAPKKNRTAQGPGYCDPSYGDGIPEDE